MSTFLKQRTIWNLSFWMIVLIPFLLNIFSCGGGGSGGTVDTDAIDDTVDSPANTAVESASVLIIPDEYTAVSNKQVPIKINSEMKIRFIEGSNTWPTGYVGTCPDGCNNISETGDPLGPWYGESVHFKGNYAGGKNLIYQYEVKFIKDVEISSIRISGAQWGTLRILDYAKRELNRYDLSGFTGEETLTLHTYGTTGKIFYIEEIDDKHTEFRYRSNIEVNYSQECASNADYVINGSDFSDISNVIPNFGDDSILFWFIEGNSIWSPWDWAPMQDTPRQWVEYEAYLTEGKWNIGLCAINNKGVANSEGLGPNPIDRYPHFKISNSLSDDIIMIRASDTYLNSGYFSINIPEDSEGWYTVRFWWLNDFYSEDGTNIFDANIKIARVFFDLIDDEDERDNSDRSDDRDDDDNRDDRDDDDDGDDRDDDDDGDDDDAVWIDRNPVSINGNNVKIYLHKGGYTNNLVINGNNFELIGDAGKNCGDDSWSKLFGTVTINGNNTIFRNLEMAGEIYENGNNITFDNVCY